MNACAVGIAILIGAAIGFLIVGVIACLAAMQGGSKARWWEEARNEKAIRGYTESELREREGWVDDAHL